MLAPVTMRLPLVPYVPICRTCSSISSGCGCFHAIVHPGTNLSQCWSGTPFSRHEPFSSCERCFDSRPDLSSSRLITSRHFGFLRGKSVIVGISPFISLDGIVIPCLVCYNTTVRSRAKTKLQHDAAAPRQPNLTFTVQYDWLGVRVMINYQKSSRSSPNH